MSLHTIEETLALLLSEGAESRLGTERILLGQLPGRILAEAVTADRPYPPFDRATMDGFACRAVDGKGPLRIITTIHAGSTSSEVVAPGTCARIMTGAPVPEGADTVVRLEDTVEENDTVRFTADVRMGRNIARVGEDAARGTELVAAGSPCTPPVIAALATTGRTDALVWKKPSVFITATGDELIRPGESAGPAQIRASNLFALGAYLTRIGADHEGTIVKDEPAEIENAVRRGLEKDVLILTGGVSKGERDYVPSLLEKLGIRTIVKGVNIKPGKPFYAGRAPGGTFVFGLPGNPFSVHVTYRIFVEPLLWTLQGAAAPGPLVLPMAESRSKKDTRAEFFPVSLSSRIDAGPDEKSTEWKGGPHPSSASEIKINGSGDIRAGLDSDGIALHPAENAVLPAGRLVEVHLW